MRVSMLVRPTALLVALATLAACSDSPVAPTAASRNLRPLGFVAPPTLQRYGVAVNVRPVDDDEVEFTIDPSQAQNVTIGQHTISFPAYSVCDPATSSYGPEYWDAPCRALREPITIRAKTSIDDGHARVDFEPALRFVPSSPWSFSRWVILSFREPRSLRTDVDYEILWKGPSGRWIDESKTDPTLRAWSDWSGNRVSRRIKHFSGYNVTAGFMDTEVSVDVSW